MSEPNHPASADQPGAQPPAVQGQPPYAQQQPAAQQAPHTAHAPQPDYPISAGHAPVAASGLPGDPAKVALIISIVGIVLGLLNTVLLYALVPMNAYSMVTLVNAVGSLIVLATHLIALVLGIIAARRTSRPLVAGIAIGISGSAVLGVAFSYMTSVIATMTL